MQRFQLLKCYSLFKLSNTHVKKLVSKETKNTVSAPAISSPLDTTSDLILIDDPPSSSPNSDTKTVKESSTPQDHEALKLLGIEHAETKADNKKLKQAGAELCQAQFKFS